MNFVYLLRCSDNTLYCGWTNNLLKRLAAHNQGTTKYTCPRRPVSLVYCEEYEEKSKALSREAKIKQLSRQQKEQLIKNAYQTEGEAITVLDKKLAPCGTLPRTLIHRYGLPHHVVHILAFEQRNHTLGVWLQQRSWDRLTLPGWYDWTATGHVHAGEDMVKAVLREAAEEADLSLDENKIEFAGVHRLTVLHQPFCTDVEIANTYIYYSKSPICLRPGPEVARMVWVSCAAISEAFRSTTSVPATSLHGDMVSIPKWQLCINPTEWESSLGYFYQSITKG